LSPHSARAASGDAGETLASSFSQQASDLYVALVFCKPPCGTHGESRVPDPKYAAYEGVAPYFSLVRGALGALVEGDHFFDIIADDVVYEVLYEFPGWPRVLQGRAELMARFKGYAGNIALRSADRLITHKTDDGRCVVIEYEVHGEILATRTEYNNRFCSIIKIENRKIAHWRDYMDSLAAWNALTAKNQR
jgi:ketosteroid isomerase-like protein